MDVLNRMFPYQSLVKVDSNSLTAWWVFATLVYFLLSLYFLYKGIRKATASLKSITSSGSVEKIENDRFLQDGWKKYSQTFLNSESTLEGFKKTFEDASTFFNGQSILGKCLNLRYWEAVPGTLVGFGILGTFVGLTFGISSFNIESTEKIKRSIEVLLSGMGTAFVSSVWGMGLSLIFGFIEKWQFAKAYGEIERFCGVLDDRFKITKADELRIARDYQDNLMRKLFVYETDEGEDVLPSFVMRDIRWEAQQQTKALKSFSTDLADGIRISSETIGILGNQFTYAIQQGLKADFAPALGKIESAVQELRKAKEESSGVIIERVISDLKNHLENLGQNFHASLSGSVTAHMEDLAKKVSDAGASLESFPCQLQSMMDVLDSQMAETKALLDSSGQSVQQTMNQCVSEISNFFAAMMEKLQSALSSQQNVIEEITAKSNESAELTLRKIREETGSVLEGFKESVKGVHTNMVSILEEQNLANLSLQKELQTSFAAMMDKLESTVSTQQNVIEEVCARINKTAEEAMQRICEAAGNAAEQFTESIKSLQDNMKTLLEQQSENTLSLQNVVSSSNDILEKGSALVSQMGDASSLIVETLDKVEALSGQLTVNSEAMSLTSENLKAITQEFSLQSTRLTGTYSQVLDRLESALNHAKETLADYSTRFAVIQEGLAGIFGQIEEGLNRYQETTRESLNQYLAQFAENLSQAVTSLRGGIEELSDVVDEIAEAKSTLSGTMRS